MNQKLETEIAKSLIHEGFVYHRINKITKVEQVKLSEDGRIALELLKRLNK